MAMFRTDANTCEYELPVVEGYSAEANGNIDACIEGFDDQLAIIESMHALDMAEIEYGRKIKALRESGAEEEEIEEEEEKLEKVTEGAIKDIFAKIKNFILKLWAKIKEFFKNVVRFFDGLFLSGKKFAEKYKAELNKVNEVEIENSYNIGKEVEGYGSVFKKAMGFSEFKDFVSDIEDGIKKAQAAKDDTAAYDELQKELDEFKDSEVNILDMTRGALVGKNSVTSDNFATELFKYFRDGKDYETTFKAKVSDAVDWLINKNMSNDVKAIQSESDNMFKAALSHISILEKTVANVDDRIAQYGTKAANILSSVVSKSQSVANSAINAWKTAISAKTTLSKQICTKALSKKNKKED